MKAVDAILYGKWTDNDPPRCFGCNAPISEPYRLTSADLTGNPDVGMGLAAFCEECLPDPRPLTVIKPGAVYIVRDLDDHAIREDDQLLKYHVFGPNHVNRVWMSLINPEYDGYNGDVIAHLDPATGVFDRVMDAGRSDLPAQFTLEEVID